MDEGKGGDVAWFDAEVVEEVFVAGEGEGAVVHFLGEGF